MAYLFVPEYHGGYPSAGHAEFAEWCRAPRPFEVEWHLHGYYHLESSVPAPAEGAPSTTVASRTEGGLASAFKRRYLTAGEGEFLALDAGSMRQRLEAGLASFRACLGAEPRGFVAPAWLFHAGLPPLLAERGIRHTEDHRYLYRTDSSGLACPAP